VMFWKNVPTKLNIPFQNMVFTIYITTKMQVEIYYSSKLCCFLLRYMDNDQLRLQLCLPTPGVQGLA
jgi:hypothetical protein